LIAIDNIILKLTDARPKLTDGVFHIDRSIIDALLKRYEEGDFAYVEKQCIKFAALNCGECCQLLATLYWQVDGYKNERKSIYWLKRAAFLEGGAQNLFNLAIINSMDDFSPTNYLLAAVLYLSASQQYDEGQENKRIAMERAKKLYEKLNEDGKNKFDLALHATGLGINLLGTGIIFDYLTSEL